MARRPRPRAMPDAGQPAVGALELTQGDGVSRFTIHAKPRASRSAVLGVREGALDVAIAAPPVDGAANDELVGLLSRALGLRKNQVEIVSGKSGRSKIVEVALSGDETRSRLTASMRSTNERDAK